MSLRAPSWLLVIGTIVTPISNRKTHWQPKTVGKCHQLTLTTITFFESRHQTDKPIITGRHQHNELTSGGWAFSRLTKFLYFAMFRDGSIKSCKFCCQKMHKSLPPRDNKTLNKPQCKIRKQ